MIEQSIAICTTSDTAYWNDNAIPTIEHESKKFPPMVSVRRPNRSTTAAETSSPISFENPTPRFAANCTVGERPAIVDGGGER